MSRRLSAAIPRARRENGEERGREPVPAVEYASGWNPCSRTYCVTVKLSDQIRTVPISIRSAVESAPATVMVRSVRTLRVALRG